jgi:hypothetical protein
MKEVPLTLSDFSINKNEIDQEKLLRSESEDDFMSLAVELFKEVIQITAILGCTYSHDKQLNPKMLTRDQAILSGLLIRLMKLQIGILDNVCQRRAEIEAILFRCLSETVVNIIYLIKSNSNSLYEEYVDYSLREEKKLLKIIDNNVESRGYELHIENRMRKSIIDSFGKSGLDNRTGR